jgi:predicted metalloprotease with PDZ domain
MTPIERGEIYPKQQEFKQWGMTARNFSFLLAKEMKRTNLDGVLVTSVRPGGPAGEAKPSLERGDVLVEINGTPVKSVEDLAERTRKLSEGKTEPVPVIATFERRAARYMAVVRVGIEEEKDPGLEVTKAWLPVETRVISREIAKQLGRPDLKGFYLTRVYPDSTAEKAGLKPGDFILALDGEKLTASGQEHEDELETLIRQYDVGKTVELSVLRDMKPMKISVELVRSPRLRREMKKYRNDDFEFTARNVSFFDSAEEQWDKNQQGALDRGGQVRQLGRTGQSLRRRPGGGSGRPAGGQRGCVAPDHGEDRRGQKAGGGDESRARHPQRLPGIRTQLETLTAFKRNLDQT